MKGRSILKAGALAALLAAGGFLLAASGIVPIKASSGHFAITEWFLNFAKRRSVATHTIGAEEPALDETWLVLKGAGHYDLGCRPCHGAPGSPQPRVARAMTPPPPFGPEIAAWEPEELFYIVKHGIKFTGMPAWPSQQRDDEVRAVVAFLLTLPDTDAEAYRRLVHREEVAASPDESLVVLGECARCHGVDGCGRELPAFPRLAGQRSEYLVAALQAYADDQRHSGIMQPIAAGLHVDDVRRLADYYADLPGCPPLAAKSASASTRGERIAYLGVPERRVPSCTDCHGPGFPDRSLAAPGLAGQYAEYLVLQLELFRSRQRGGGSHAHLMDPVASRMTSEQMYDVAMYYSSLPPTGQ
ncbi:c-type cytochrome [Nannocystis exedens]|uniref:c-type cytochrome n=1 Tax=Nannocystis exedens TaxID=54 RepID=UPI000BBA0217|nr:c-type cytochrome [Nannocystis exedens]PCC68825.1 cytochrome c [Nannocystis exedens]